MKLELLANQVTGRVVYMLSENVLFSIMKRINEDWKVDKETKYIESKRRWQVRSRAQQWEVKAKQQLVIW